MYDVAIIGAGVAGTFIARQLAKYQLKILLLDKENDVGNETTMANSAIIHAGYDAKAGYKKGDFNSLGNKLYDKVCDELDVPFKRCGSLVIGFDEEDEKTIEELYHNGVRNDVLGMKILTGDEVREMEENLSEAITCALYAPTAGIISPFDLAAALAENAVDNGVELRFETEVKAIDSFDDHYRLVTDKGNVMARTIINCAGVFADEISAMVVEPYFKIRPRKGQYFIMDKSEGDLVHHIIFQCPTKKGKGVLVTPTVHGNLLIGPDSEFIDDKDDLSTDAEQLDYIRRTAVLTTDKIKFSKTIRVFAGLRATSDIGDFIIEQVAGTPSMINVAGYESPGLSSIPAVADYVVNIYKEMVGSLQEKSDYNPRRRPFKRFHEMTAEQRQEAIAENSKFGRIICRCEMVTEAEIIDSIQRSAGATSIKGVKKRTRAGTGRCQGGFCGPRVQEIIARELGETMEEVPYDSHQAYILTEETKSGH